MSNITHYNGCWHDPKHHACAMREIEQLQKKLAKTENWLRLYREAHHKNLALIFNYKESPL